MTEQKPDYFREICRLTEQLHASMIKVDKSANPEDETESDLIRDQMDYPWYQLTEEEQRWARAISAGFYSIAEFEEERRKNEISKNTKI